MGTSTTVASGTHGPPHDSGGGVPPWAALPVIIAGSLTVVLDFFIVNVALPSIALDLNAGSASLEGIVASYAVMEAIFLITGSQPQNRPNGRLVRKPSHQGPSGCLLGAGAVILRWRCLRRTSSSSDGISPPTSRVAWMHGPSSGTRTSVGGRPKGRWTTSEFHGHDAMRRYYREWEETFDVVSTEIEELTIAGDKVVAAVRGVGRMKGSDAEIDIHYAIVLSFRDGKISKGREYFSREEALEAAGLSE